VDNDFSWLFDHLMDRGLRDDISLRARRRLSSVKHTLNSVNMGNASPNLLMYSSFVSSGRERDLGTVWCLKSLENRFSILPISRET
jgi:hypothetical protein